MILEVLNLFVLMMLITIGFVDYPLKLLIVVVMMMIMMMLLCRSFVVVVLAVVVAVMMKKKMMEVLTCGFQLWIVVAVDQ